MNLKNWIDAPARNLKRWIEGELVESEDGMPGLGAGMRYKRRGRDVCTSSPIREKPVASEPARKKTPSFPGINFAEAPAGHPTLKNAGGLFGKIALSYQTRNSPKMGTYFQGWLCRGV